VLIGSLPLRALPWSFRSASRLLNFTADRHFLPNAAANPSGLKQIRVQNPYF
jgi:hypothetical protein